MAKKKTASDPTTPTRTTATRKRQPKAEEPAAAPIDIATVSRTEPIEPIQSANDRRAPAGDGDAAPSHDEIAEAAYRRYLDRGGRDGADFDDWVEAERELRSRRSR